MLKELETFGWELVLFLKYMQRHQVKEILFQKKRAKVSNSISQKSF